MAPEWRNGTEDACDDNKHPRRQNNRQIDMKNGISGQQVTESFALIGLWRRLTLCPAFAKVIIISIGCLLGFLVLRFYDPKLASHGRPLSEYVGYVVGVCLIPWMVGVLIALRIKGRAGVLLGLISVCIINGLMFLGGWVEKRANNSVADELKKVRQTAQAQLDTTGDIAISTQELAQSLTNIVSQAGLLSIRDSNALAAVVTVLTPILECRRETDAIYEQMANPKVTNPNNWQKKEDLNEALRLYQQFKELYEKQLTLCDELDVALKIQLRNRGYTPLQAQTVAQRLFNDRTMEISIGLLRCNIDSADVGIRQFRLLKDNWGAWSIRGGKVVFARQELKDQWNQTIRDWFQMAETKEALGRRLIASK